MKILLPVKEPMIKGYTYYAHICSMLQNNPDTYEWIYSNFIQLVFSANDAKYSWGDFYSEMPYEANLFNKCEWLAMCKVRRKDIVINKDI